MRRPNEPWGLLENLGPSSIGNENDATSFVGDSGEVLVAWFSTQLCEGECSNPGYTRVAVAPAGAGRFRQAQTLERDAIGVASPSSHGYNPLVLARAGRASMLVLTAGSATPYAAPVVKVAHRDDGDTFGAPQAISPAGQYPMAIRAATGPRGAIVTWSSAPPPGAGSVSAVFAAVLDPATEHFGPPEQVSPDSENAYQVLPTFNPASHWPANAIPRWTVALVTQPVEGGRRHQTIVSATMPVCPRPPATVVPTTPPPDPACLGA